MKLTNEKVAKALGWESLMSPRAKGRLECYWQRSRSKAGLPPSNNPAKWTDEHFGPPHFTTSLDAIVSEIEARGLNWEVLMFSGGHGFWGKVYKWDRGSDSLISQDAKTAPLALCSALLSYLKESPNG